MLSDHLDPELSRSPMRGQSGGNTLSVLIVTLHTLDVASRDRYSKDPDHMRRGSADVHGPLNPVGDKPGAR
jgi:hypothetical protein